MTDILTPIKQQQPRSLSTGNLTQAAMANYPQYSTAPAPAMRSRSIAPLPPLMLPATVDIPALPGSRAISPSDSVGSAGAKRTRRDSHRTSPYSAASPYDKEEVLVKEDKRIRSECRSSSATFFIADRVSLQTKSRLNAFVIGQRRELPNEKPASSFSSSVCASLSAARVQDQVLAMPARPLRRMRRWWQKIADSRLPSNDLRQRCVAGCKIP